MFHFRAEADAEMAKQVQQDLMRQKQANELAGSLTDEVGSYNISTV